MKVEDSSSLLSDLLLSASEPEEPALLALKSADRDAVESHVAWPAVKDSLRAELQARARAAVTAAANRRLRPGGAIKSPELSWKSSPLIDRIVEVIATPEGLIALFNTPELDVRHPEVQSPPKEVPITSWTFLMTLDTLGSHFQHFWMD